MSKKRKKDVPAVETAALTHSPFAKLAGAVSPGDIEPANGEASERAPAGPEPSADTNVERAPGRPADRQVPGPGGGSLADLSKGQKVVVRRETKGRGGKTVTRISGLPAARLDALAPQMKKALGCGAVREGDDLLLLGSLVDRAAEWLVAQGAPRIVRAS